MNKDSSLKAHLLQTSRVALRDTDTLSLAFVSTTSCSRTNSGIGSVLCVAGEGKETGI